MKGFKVLLVYPNLQMVNLLPSNIAILSAHLRKAGIDVRLFDTTLYRTSEKSVDELRVEHMQLRPFNLKEKGVDYKSSDVFDDFRILVEVYKPNVIGLSLTDDTYDLGIELISKIRSNNNGAHVIAGGIRPTSSPEETIKNDNIDSVCIGEGEDALLELCRKMQADDDITSIKNLWVKKNSRVYKNGLRKPVDLNDIPYEDFSVFEEKRFFRPMQGKVFRMIPISTDRGCPFNCSFCAAPYKRNLYRSNGGGPYFRTKKISRIMDELKFQIETYKADYVYFNSETFFAMEESNLEEFAKRYAVEIGLPFWCQTRIETITDRKIRILEDMNCDRISIGLEHGNEDFRKRILKKNFTNQQAIDAFKTLERSRVSVTVNNIVGFPDETRELAFDTINLNRSIKADSINAYFYTPYRGTPLRQYCIDKRYLDPNTKIKNPMMDTMLRMPQFPAMEIRGLVRTFPLYVKMPKRYFGKIKIAERFDPDGEDAFAELREIFYKEYFV